MIDAFVDSSKALSTYVNVRGICTTDKKQLRDFVGLFVFGTPGPLAPERAKPSPRGIQRGIQTGFGFEFQLTDRNQVEYNGIKV